MTAAPSAPSTVFRGVGVGMLVAWLYLAFASLVPNGLALLSWAALAIALLVAVARPQVSERALAILEGPSRRAFLVGCASAAALLSWLLVSGPMGERPLSIDATVYLLQARALSHGQFGLPIPEPRQLFGARFLFEGADGRLHGVFPPGFPLFLAAFVRLSAPMLAGPVIAALLVLAQALLGRAIEGRDGPATRLSIILALPSFARAVETADLLSHAFVAVLGTVAVAFAILCRERASMPRLLAIGAALGWAITARLLDGILFAAVTFSILGHAVATRKLRIARALVPLLSLLPFLCLLLLAQKAATGSYAVPTQVLYFARSDWPASCHRLGFGVDVGCAVEHGDARASFGPDGYTLPDALRVVRERAAALGGDLFGLPAIALIGFAGVAVRGGKRDALLAATIVAFTLAYGLFYYGNAPVFGARHLFPIAPLFWLLSSRAAVTPLHRRLGRGLALAVVAAAVVAAVPRWVWSVNVLRAESSKRVDVRRVIDQGELARGLVVTGDELSWIAAFDPLRDGPDRIVVRFDRSGLKDLRRARPELPIHALLEGDVHQTQTLPAPGPGLQVELERAWPSFVRPDGLATRTVRTKACCNVESSGEQALFIFAAREGASVSIPFTVPRAGRFALRVDGLVAPDYGTYAIAVDDQPLPDWDGYAETIGSRSGTPSAPIELSAGAHTLTLRCTGKRAESRGLLGAFDVLIGTP